MLAARNSDGFPVVDKLAQAQAVAAAARERLAAAPCTCAECVKATNLPSVQRILARWTPMDRGFIYIEK